MDDDLDTLDRFEHRLAGIEANVKDPPLFDHERRTMPGPNRKSRSLVATVAVVAIVVAVVAVGSLIGGARPTGPTSSSSVVGGSGTATPVATPSPAATTVRTVMIDEWSARCVDVQKVDCIGAAGIFLNQLGRSYTGMFESSGGVLTVEARPACPLVPDWADGSYCWQVSVTGNVDPETGKPICIVIARRTTDTRYPPYGQVGGSNLSGAANSGGGIGQSCS